MRQRFGCRIMTHKYTYAQDFMGFWYNYDKFDLIVFDTVAEAIDHYEKAESC